jgi:hypothetical protein
MVLLEAAAGTIRLGKHKYAIPSLLNGTSASYQLQKSRMASCDRKRPNVAVNWVALLLCIREAPASNFGPDTLMFFVANLRRPGKFRQRT